MRRSKITLRIPTISTYNSYIETTQAIPVIRYTRGARTDAVESVEQPGEGQLLLRVSFLALMREQGVDVLDDDDRVLGCLEQQQQQR